MTAIDFEYYKAYGFLYMCYICTSDVFVQMPLCFAIVTAVLQLQSHFNCTEWPQYDITTAV